MITPPIPVDEVAVSRDDLLKAVRIDCVLGEIGIERHRRAHMRYGVADDGIKPRCSGYHGSGPFVAYAQKGSRAFHGGTGQALHRGIHARDVHQHRANGDEGEDGADRPHEKWRDAAVRQNESAS